MRPPVKFAMAGLLASVVLRNGHRISRRLLLFYRIMYKTSNLPFPPMPNDQDRRAKPHTMSFVFHTKADAVGRRLERLVRRFES